MSAKDLNITLVVNAAQGWLELGNPVEALRELQKVPSSACDLNVLRLRYTAFAVSSDWLAASIVADVAVELYRQEPESWLWRAEATFRRTGSAAEAREALGPARKMFPDNKQLAKAFEGYEG